MPHLDLTELQRRWTWTGDFKCREVKTGFYRNRSMQTGSSGTLIGWKSGQTTFVPLWYWMEGAWLWTQYSSSFQHGSTKLLHTKTIDCPALYLLFCILKILRFPKIEIFSSFKRQIVTSTYVPFPFLFAHFYYFLCPYYLILWPCLLVLTLLLFKAVYLFLYLSFLGASHFCIYLLLFSSMSPY